MRCDLVSPNPQGRHAPRGSDVPTPPGRVAGLEIVDIGKGLEADKEVVKTSRERCSKPMAN